MTAVIKPGYAVDRLAGELARLVGAPVELERPAKAEHGDYATNVAMRLAPQRGRAPRELAEELAAQVVELPEVERAEVAGPGFANLWLPTSGSRTRCVRSDPEYGGGSAERPNATQVEMVSANPTGPITVASARNGAYGDGVARLLEFAGHTVEREYYYNDAGVQMDRFRASIEARRRGEEPPEDGYRGEYVDELAALFGRSGAADARARSRPPSSASASTSTAGRFRASSSSGSPSCCHACRPTNGTAPSSSARPSTATRRTACSSAPPSAAACRRTRRQTSST